MRISRPVGWILAAATWLLRRTQLTQAQEISPQKISTAGVTPPIAELVVAGVWSLTMPMMPRPIIQRTASGKIMVACGLAGGEDFGLGGAITARWASSSR